MVPWLCFRLDGVWSEGLAGLDRWRLPVDGLCWMHGVRKWFRERGGWWFPSWRCGVYGTKSGALGKMFGGLEVMKFRHRLGRFSPFAPFFQTPSLASKPTSIPPFSRYLCASCPPIRIPSVYRPTTFSPCYFCPPVPLVFHLKHHHAQRQPNKSPCLSELLTAILFPLLLPLLSPLSPSRFAIPL